MSTVKNFGTLETEFQWTTFCICHNIIIITISKNRKKDIFPNNVRNNELVN